MTAMEQRSERRPGRVALRVGVVAFAVGVALALVLAGVDVARGPGAPVGGGVGTFLVRLLCWGGAGAVVVVGAVRLLTRR